MTDELVELVDIKYESPNLWDQYIKEDVMRVYVATLKVRKLYRQAKSYVYSLYNKLDDELKKILLGGVELFEDGSFGYTENSSAIFYAEVFGIRLGLKGYRDYFKLLPNASVPIRVEPKKPIVMHHVEDYILAEVYDVTIKDYVREMNNLAKKVIIAGGGRLPDSVPSVSLSNLNQVIETFKELLEALANFTSVYNPKTFFVTTLTGSTLKAFLEAYDKLNNPEVMNSVFKRFGVQTLVDLSQLTGRKEYNIVSYNNNSLGGLIKRLDDLVYEFLEKFYTNILKLESNIKKDYDALLSYYINSTPLGEVLKFTYGDPIHCSQSSDDLTVECKSPVIRPYRRWPKKYTLVEMLDDFSIPLLLYYELNEVGTKDGFYMSMDRRHQSRYWW